MATINNLEAAIKHHVKNSPRARETAAKCLARVDRLRKRLESRLEVTIHDSGVHFRPVKDASGHKDRVRESASRMARIHHKALKELAG